MVSKKEREENGNMQKYVYICTYASMYVSILKCISIFFAVKLWCNPFFKKETVAILLVSVFLFFLWYDDTLECILVKITFFCFSSPSFISLFSLCRFFFSFFWLKRHTKREILGSVGRFAFYVVVLH